MSWWADQEGLLGDLTSRITSEGGLGLLGTGAASVDVTWHAVQAASKPNATAHGPYATQAQAQAEADTLNSTAAPTVLNQSAQTAAGALSGTVLGPLFQPAIWLRVGEVALGLMLIVIGLAKITHAGPAVADVAKVAAL